ncbi:hypothetical protein [Sunxiuqinia indica]|uniref:hypothetical protein n=1 Tax=Sunxiuqinia indica TaxID=2692584 RepID=UPI001359AB4C|nr:hypothetical protein [Sunxiuqinia indica]
MSILAQYNVLGVYASKEARLWESLKVNGNPELFRIFLETNTIPAIQLIVDNASTASVQLLDANDNPLGSPLSMTILSETGYKKVIYAGTTLSGYDDGDYSLKITIDAVVYYTDVFGWTSNEYYLDDLLKITAVSSNIRLSNYYDMDLTGFTFECYINSEYLGLQPEVDEEIATRGGVTKVLYGNLVPLHEFEVYAAEYIYRFLLGLRVLESNGTVTVTWKSVSYTANDIMTDVTENNGNKTYQLKLTFIDISETISVNNKLN